MLKHVVKGACATACLSTLFTSNARPNLTQLASLQTLGLLVSPSRHPQAQSRPGSKTMTPAASLPMLGLSGSA